MQVIGICRFSWPGIGGFQVEHETLEQRIAFLYAPERMEERFRTFETVTLPPLRFTFFVFTCIITVLSLKQFDYIFTETQGGPGNASSVLTYQLYKISFINLELGYGAAMSFYLLALILAVTLSLYFFWGRREARDA